MVMNLRFDLEEASIVFRFRLSVFRVLTMTFGHPQISSQPRTEGGQRTTSSPKQFAVDPICDVPEHLC